MSQWITDRLPAEDDGYEDTGMVWAHSLHGAYVIEHHWSNVRIGQPWTKIGMRGCLDVPYSDINRSKGEWL